MEDQHTTPTAGTPIYQESQEKNAKWLWLLIIIIIIGALIFAYVRGIGPFASLKGGQATTSPTPTSLPSPSPTPEATGEADLDKSEPEIRVLNGSGTAGVAGVVQNLLEEKGWNVVSVGNADSFDFEQTVLRFKSTFKKFEEALTEDLSDDYSVITGDEDLEATDSADIEVIVGSK
jgi:hypothetical protein